MVWFLLAIFHLVVAAFVGMRESREEIMPLPSTNEFCNPVIKTGSTELDTDGRFTDTIVTSTAPTGIRISNDISIRSLQRIYVLDVKSGRPIDIRLNLVEIRRSGVTVTDISDTGTRVPRN